MCVCVNIAMKLIQKRNKNINNIIEKMYILIFTINIIIVYYLSRENKFLRIAVEQALASKITLYEKCI